MGIRIPPTHSGMINMYTTQNIAKVVNDSSRKQTAPAPIYQKNYE